jgi:hypothetical protein
VLSCAIVFARMQIAVRPIQLARLPHTAKRRRAAGSAEFDGLVSLALRSGLRWIIGKSVGTTSNRKRVMVSARV